MPFEPDVGSAGSGLGTEGPASTLPATCASKDTMITLLRGGASVIHLAGGDPTTSGTRGHHTSRPQRRTGWSRLNRSKRNHSTTESKIWAIPESFTFQAHNHQPPCLTPGSTQSDEPVENLGCGPSTDVRGQRPGNDRHKHPHPTTDNKHIALAAKASTHHRRARQAALVTSPVLTDPRESANPLRATLRDRISAVDQPQPGARLAARRRTTLSNAG